jgi:hypothetical protein
MTHSYSTSNPRSRWSGLANAIDARVIFPATLAKKSDNADSMELSRNFLSSEKIV